MVRVEHDYAFEAPDGRRSLAELFDGRSQLILYRFFFEEGVDGWPDAGRVGCSSVADGIPELGLLHARDITFAMASPAPQANLRRYAERMGWTHVPWYTIRSERFSADFGVDEWFGFDVFLRDGNDVYRTYFLQHGAMVQWIGSLWSLWSLTPYGGSPTTRTCPRAGRGRRGRSGSAAMTSSTIRRRRPAGASTRMVGPSGWRTPQERQFGEEGPPGPRGGRGAGPRCHRRPRRARTVARAAVHAGGSEADACWSGPPTCDSFSPSGLCRLRRETGCSAGRHARVNDPRWGSSSAPAVDAVDARRLSWT